jgi:hypothetical protein
MTAHPRGALAAAIGLPAKCNPKRLPLGRIIAQADATIIEKACGDIDLATSLWRESLARSHSSTR